MNARARTMQVESVALQAKTGCAVCAACEPNLCQATAEVAWALPPGTPIQFHQATHTVPARRIVFHKHDLSDAVPIICEGWAASIVMLSDGSRQILSFLLPGDLVSTVLLFQPRPHWLVEAITKVRYRTFKRSELKEFLFKQPKLSDKLLKAWLEEKSRSDQIIVDLGRRTAEERIARLILDLQERLALRGMVRSDMMEMDFPLRQHHIADALGLTPVHVSKVLSEFRRAGLIKIQDRSLTIVDEAGFRRVAHMR